MAPVPRQSNYAIPQRGVIAICCARISPRFCLRYGAASQMLAITRHDISRSLSFVKALLVALRLIALEELGVHHAPILVRFG